MNKHMKNDTFLDELHAIRLELYEETKNMSSEERVAYIHQLSAPILKEFGITPISRQVTSE